MTSKPRLLYISPVTPALTGNGLAMRAGMVLEVLAERYDVNLLVVPIYACVTPTIPEYFEKLCRQTAVESPLRFRRRSGAAGPVWKDTRFHVVHVFRLITAAYGEPYWGGFFRRPRRHLDLDDIESRTHRRLGALYVANGDPASAAQEEAEAARSEELEDAAFRRFDRLYVCSDADGQLLVARTRTKICVLPNGVRIPESVPPCVPQDLFTFLFVGTLGYYPNQDAVRFLCAEIVPRLQEMAGSNFVVHIAGTGASELLQQIMNVPQVKFLGAVEDLRPCYAQADAIVAPVRGGGGTRIKILEAFSFQRPVVATSMGMEGIDARAEEHALIGDTPDEFAKQCTRLIADAALREKLAQNALALVQRAYSLSSLRRRHAQLDQPQGK